MVLSPRAGRHDPASGFRQRVEGRVISAPRPRVVELEGAGEGQRSAAGRAGDGAGGWGRRQDLMYLPSALSL